MNQRYPTRTNTHNLETLSERFFQNALPRNWVAQRLSNDYGVDLKVDIFEGTQATGLEFLVQLKSSERASESQMERIRLELKTYNHLANKLQVVMLVKYVEELNEAYWLLLLDVPPPKQGRKTFTVHLPKENTLSTIPWKKIESHVGRVTRDKLTTREQIEQMRKDFQEYLCPFCGSELDSRVDAPADLSQDHWDVRETFSCGFQRFGNELERPCPNDPDFPDFEDYDLKLIHRPEEPVFKWQGIAFGKTNMARELRLDIGVGETQDDVIKQIRESYHRYAKKGHMS